MMSVCFLLSVLLAWFVCSYHYDACLYLYHRASYSENLTVGHSLHLMCGTGRHANESVGTEHLCILPHSDAYASTPYKKNSSIVGWLCLSALSPFTNDVTAI